MSDFPDWTVPTNIQNPQIDVRVVEGNVNANITNSEINTVITDSKIVLDVSSSAWQAGLVTFGIDPANADGWRYCADTFAKVFAHGCTGILHAITYRFRNTGTVSYTVKIGIRAHIAGPDIVTIEFTIGPGQEIFETKYIDIPWFWDSLVVVIYDLDTPYVQVATLSTGDKDSFFYGFQGWDVLPDSLAIKIHMITRTKNFVAVSGQVVAVPLPKKQHAFSSDWKTVEPYTEVQVLKITGRGKFRYAFWVVGGNAFLHTVLRIYADGNVVTGYYQDRPDAINYYAGVQTKTRPALLVFDSSAHKAVLVYDEEVEFQRELRVVFYNYDANNSAAGRVLALHYELW